MGHALGLLLSFPMTSAPCTRRAGPPVSPPRAQVWLLAAQLEVRQLKLDSARKVLGTALGMCPKHKLYKAYVDLELQLGHVDRCRTCAALRCAVLGACSRRGLAMPANRARAPAGAVQPCHHPCTCSSGAALAGWMTTCSAGLRPWASQVQAQG